MSLAVGFSPIWIDVEATRVCLYEIIYIKIYIIFFIYKNIISLPKKKTKSWDTNLTIISIYVPDKWNLVKIHVAWYFNKNVIFYLSTTCMMICIDHYTGRKETYCFNNVVLRKCDLFLIQRFLIFNYNISPNKWWYFFLYKILGSPLVITIIIFLFKV